MSRLLAGLIVLCVGGTAAAAPFQNGSFESGTVTPCNTFNISGAVITGWNINVGNVDWEGPLPSCGWQSSSGNASLDMVGSSAGGIGGIEQTFDTVPGTTYQVSFDMAGNTGAPPVIKPLDVTINGVTTHFTFDTTGHTGSAMGWTTHTLLFTATGASSTIQFVSDVSASGGTLNAGAALDNVRIGLPGAAVAVEVPLDWAQWLAALAIAALAATGLRRRAQRG
jgi:choice-of-anchor C domain-containing protein